MKPLSESVRTMLAMSGCSPADVYNYCTDTSEACLPPSILERAKAHTHSVYDDWRKILFLRY